MNQTDTPRSYRAARDSIRPKLSKFESDRTQYRGTAALDTEDMQPPQPTRDLRGLTAAQIEAALKENPT